jgi:anti-sigma-K factor RskA
VSHNDPIRDPYLELIEAYALGALESEEQASLEAHLATGCAECSKALADARWTVSQLAYLAPEAQPSELLRGRLFKTVRAEAQASSSTASAKSKSVIPLWMWAAVAAAVLFAFFNAYEARDFKKKINELEKTQVALTRHAHESEDALLLAKREAIILTDPRSVKIAMPPGKKDLPQLQATWHAVLGIVVSGRSLPAPAGNRTLQLWLIPKAPGSKPVPSLAIRPDADGKYELLVASPPGTQADTKALAITEEPEGGSVQPTTSPIWVGAVSAQ